MSRHLPNYTSLLANRETVTWLVAALDSGTLTTSGPARPFFDALISNTPFLVPSAPPWRVNLRPWHSHTVIFVPQPMTVHFVGCSLAGLELATLEQRSTCLLPAEGLD